MIITTSSNAFQTDFFHYDLVGFHGTSSLITDDIEKHGLLPKKVFADAVHDRVKTLGKELGINTRDYEEWLGMLSVSFGTDAEAAIAQMNRGFVGGQGLFNMEKLLSKALELGNAAQQAFAQVYLDQIDAIRKSSVVIYAFDLSAWKDRVVKDYGGLQFYFNPAEPLPKFSPIAPSLIIERLDLM